MWTYFAATYVIVVWNFTRLITKLKRFFYLTSIWWGGTQLQCIYYLRRILISRPPRVFRRFKRRSWLPLTPNEETVRISRQCCPHGHIRPPVIMWLHIDTYCPHGHRMGSAYRLHRGPRTGIFSVFHTGSVLIWLSPKYQLKLLHVALLWAAHMLTSSFIKLVRVWRMSVIHLIIIKSKIRNISHCLNLGHETMVCAVSLTMFLWSFSALYICRSTKR